MLRRGIVLVPTLVALVAGALSADAQQNVLRASGPGSNPPYNYTDPVTGLPAGIAVDIVNAVAADMGWTVEWSAPIRTADFIQSILDNVIDTYASNLIITAARIEQVAFSTPWQVSPGEGIFVLSTDETDYRGIQDFRGLAIGAVRGTPPAAAIEAMTGVFAEVRLYDNNEALAQGVIAGEVRGGVTAMVNVQYSLALGLYPELKVPPNYQGSITVGGLYGFPFHKNATTLLNAFNASLGKLTADGTVREIFSRYGLSYLDYTR